MDVVILSPRAPRGFWCLGGGWWVVGGWATVSQLKVPLGSPSGHTSSLEDLKTQNLTLF